MLTSDTSPTLAWRAEGGRAVPVLVWRFRPARLMIASGPLGGGIGRRDWLINASVPMSYDRDDPDRHLIEIATALGLAGRGAGLLTGVDVGRYVQVADGGAELVATVGIGAPILAAAPTVPGPTPGVAGGEPGGSGSVAGGNDATPVGLSAAAHGPVAGGHPVGTINIVAAVPVRLSPAALVNAVATITEAKTQALRELGVAGTGTCTDAVCLSCTADGAAEAYGGPRSTWGGRLARAAHAAVLAGGADWLARPCSWSQAARAGQPRPDAAG